MHENIHNLEETADRLRVLAHPIRIQIVLELEGGSKNVGELTELLGIAQPAMSQHLGLLRSQGWVVKQRRALHAYYSLTSDTVATILKRLQHVIDKI